MAAPYVAAVEVYVIPLTTLQMISACEESVSDS